MGNRLTNIDILEYVYILRHGKQNHITGGNDLALTLGFAIFQTLCIVVREANCNINGAGLQINHHCGLFCIVANGDLFCGRLIAPVILVALKGCIGAGYILYTGVGAGTHRGVPDFVLGHLTKLLAHNGGPAEGNHTVDEQYIRLLELNGQLHAVHRAVVKINVVITGICRIGGRTLGEMTEGIQHVLWRQRISIGELYTVPDGKYHGGIIRPLPIGGQTWLKLSIYIHTHHSVIDKGHTNWRALRLSRIKASGICHHTHGQRISGGSRCFCDALGSRFSCITVATTARGEGSQQHRRSQQGGQYFLCHLHFFLTSLFLEVNLCDPEMLHTRFPPLKKNYTILIFINQLY